MLSVQRFFRRLQFIYVDRMQDRLTDVVIVLNLLFLFKALDPCQHMQLPRLELFACQELRKDCRHELVG
jgi:hypothetical protein